MQHIASELNGSRIRLDYHVELRYQLAGPADFHFLIHPARTPHQEIVTESLTIDPELAHTLDTDPVTGNRLMKLHAETPGLAVRLDALVEVRHHVEEPSHVSIVEPAALPVSATRYLVASRYCQTDQLTSEAWRRFGHLPRGYAQVQAVCDWVRERTTFRVGTSHVGTSALDTLTCREGVCRDFAHLAITFLRALNYPARLVTGVDYGADPALGPPDFHCYVEVYFDRWYLFDPTGISPTTGLIRIATGRDAADVSFATIFGPVTTGMPLVKFSAIEDPDAGIHAPRPTSLAVSTAAV